MGVGQECGRGNDGMPALKGSDLFRFLFYEDYSGSSIDRETGPGERGPIGKIRNNSGENCWQPDVAVTL